MRSILKLTFANIRQGRGAFKSIFVLMLLVIFAFSPTISNDDNVKRQMEESFEHAEVGDLLITIDESCYTPELEEVLNNNEHVTSWRADSLIRIQEGVKAGGEVIGHTVRLCEPDGHYRVINEDSTGFIEGCDTKTPGEGEVFIPYALSRSLGAGIGDTVTFPTKNGEESLKISGIIEEPVYGGILIGAEKFYISESDFNRILAEDLDDEDAPVRNNTHVYMMQINGDGKLSDIELSKLLNIECKIVDNSMLYITEAELKDSTMMVCDVGTRILIVFLVLLTAVVVISLYNNISSSIQMDYTELGVLKSQGFTTGDIRMVYILQYLLALVSGGLIGVACSYPLTKAAGKAFMQLTGIITYGNVSWGKCIIFTFVMVLICIAAVFLALSKVSKISPVNAINGGTSDVYFSELIHVKIRQKALNFSIAIRQITSRVRSYLGIVFIAAILVFFMVSITQMLQNLTAEEVYGGEKDVAVAAGFYNSFDYSDMDAVRDEVLSKYPDAQVFYYTREDMMVDDILYSVSVTDQMDVYARTYAGRAPIYDNEVAVTDISAEELGKDIGDTVIINTNKGAEEFIITGRFQTVMENGRTVTLNFGGGSLLGCDIESVSVVLKGASGEDKEAIADLLNDRFGDKLIASVYEESKFDESLWGVMDSILGLILGVIYGVSAVFAFFVIQMLCKKEIIRETHDLGVFKATGFSSSALRTGFAIRFLTVAVTGSLLGILLAVLLTERFYVIIFRSLGITNFIGSLSISGIIVPAAIMCTAFFVFAYISSGKIRRVDIRQLITE